MHGSGPVAKLQKKPAGQIAAPFVEFPLQRMPGAHGVGAAVPSGQEKPTGQGPSHDTAVLLRARPKRPPAQGVGRLEAGGQKEPWPHAFAVALMEPAPHQ